MSADTARPAGDGGPHQSNGQGDPTGAQILAEQAERLQSPSPRASLWAGFNDASVFASLLAAPDGVTEIRVLRVKSGEWHGVVSGYFVSLDKLLEAARRLDGHAGGVYVTMNPAKPELLARCAHRIERSPKYTTNDSEIVRRTTLLIDIDPVRPSGISATDEEHNLALALADEVQAYLTSVGFPDPLVADSGNGAYVAYRIDEPCDDGGLVQRVLAGLAFRFDNAHAHVDQGVYNPSRLVKLIGTLARKGDPLPDRPHRRSRVIRAPQVLAPVPHEALVAIAQQVPGATTGSKPSGSTLDIDDLLAKNSIEVARTGPWQGGRRWVLKTCPFNSEHVDQSAYVVQFSSGAVVAGCHHNGCAGRSWKDLAVILGVGRDDGGASGSYGSASPPGKQRNWPDPEPLPDELLPVAPFDARLLPAAFRPWIEDIARRIQCGLDYLAVALMVALAGVVGRRMGIRPKQRDDWLVVANLWGSVIGRPGILKTPAVQEVLRPLQRLEIKGKEVFDAAMREAAAAQLVDKERKKKAAKEIKDALEDESEEDPMSIARKTIEALPDLPTRERLMVNDATIEKLGELLNENPNGLLLYRDEFVGFLRSMDKEGHECARAFYLEAWNGTGRFTYDRIGRGTIDIEATTLSMIGCIQPGPLISYLHGAVEGTQQDDGFMQRLQLTVWPDISKDWVNVDEFPDTEARAQAFAVFEHLNSFDPLRYGAFSEPGDDIPSLRFTVEAQEVFDAWREWLEGVVRSGEEHPAIESHLAKYRSLVPSLALLLHLADNRDGNVCKDSVELAIEWVKYLESHARRIYSVAVARDAICAKALSRKILAGEVKDRFTLRDVYRNCWSALSDREDVERAVNALMDAGWLASEREQTGGAPKTVYLINPKVYELGKNADKAPDADWGTL